MRRQIIDRMRGHTSDSEKVFLDASLTGDIDTVRRFLDQVNINVKNEFGFTSLMFASMKNYVEMVQLLLERGADVNSQNEKGASALFYASMEGHIDIAKLLLDKGADVNATTFRNETALSVAVSNSQQNEIVKLLLNRGAKVKIEGKPLPSNLLTIPIMSSDIELIELLLDKGALNLTDITGKTPLNVALEQKDRENIVQLLLDKGADVNSALFYVLKKMDELSNFSYDHTKYLSMIKFLLQHGADVNAKFGKKITLLMIAAEYGDEELAEFLLSHGADVNEKNDNDYTALMYAVFYGKSPRIVQLLLEKGANRDITFKTYGEEDTSLLDVAISKGNVSIVKLLIDGADMDHVNHALGYLFETLKMDDPSASEKYPIIKLLLEKGANPNLKLKYEGNELNPLKLALLKLRSKSKDIVELLIDHGADVNNTDSRYTALLFSSQKGYTSLVKLLLEKGADVNAKTPNKNTALILASANGHVSIVEMLLDRGVNVNEKNGKYSALMYALENGHGNVVETLLNVDGVDVDVDMDRLAKTEEVKNILYRYFHKTDELLYLKKRDHGPNNRCRDGKPFQNKLKNAKINKEYVKDGKPTCFDVSMYSEYDLIDYLNGEDEDTKPYMKETAKKNRCIFFVGENISNLTPFCYSFSDLKRLYHDDTAFFSAECKEQEFIDYPDDPTVNPNVRGQRVQFYAYRNPIVALRFSTIVYVYLNDLIDAIETGKRVFVLLPCFKDENDEKQLEFDRTISLSVIKTYRAVSGDHCQNNTNKKVHNIYVCEGTPENPLSPIEYKNEI